MGASFTMPVGSGLTTALTYAAWGAVVAPLTIVAHELGHFGVGLLLGTPDLALHYGSVSDTASEQGFPAARIGAQALAGPVATLLIMAACVMGLRKKVHPFFVVALIVAPIRFAVGAVYLAFSLQAAIQGGARGQPNFDEFKAAQALGFAVEPLLIFELVATIAIWVWMFRRLERGTRFNSLCGAVAGVAVGIGAWIALIGPWLLP
jgi:hypothetical protein